MCLEYLILTVQYKSVSLEKGFHTILGNELVRQLKLNYLEIYYWNMWIMVLLFYYPHICFQYSCHRRQNNRGENNVQTSL